MPLHLEPLNISDELQEHSSALIVTCPICPPASLASDSDSPLIDFFKRGIKTPAYEDFIGELTRTLEQRGIKTGVFTSYLPSPIACGWTKGQRKRLLKRARNFDTVLVMGCESARYTVEETLKDTDCEVILAMRFVGITNASLTFEFPFTLRLGDLACVDANQQAAQELKP
ncbi:MAG: hypothetical protein QNJ11_14510 [Woeseiaceae bacterium]|nr:hypothetical protein [Woeseiaceae bacterium]